MKASCKTFWWIRLRRLFGRIDFPACRKSSMGKPTFCKFCVYFPSRIRGTCMSVASVLRGMCATLGDGAWKQHMIYGQHTCTARYGRVNSGNNLSVLGNQNEFQILQKLDLLMSEIIYRYKKLFSDISNYLSKSGNTGYIFIWRPWPIYWHSLTLNPEWISNLMTGEMGDEIAYIFQTAKC